MIPRPTQRKLRGTDLVRSALLVSESRVVQVWIRVVRKDSMHEMYVCITRPRITDGHRSRPDRTALTSRCTLIGGLSDISSTSNDNGCEGLRPMTMVSYVWSSCVAEDNRK